MVLLTVSALSRAEGVRPQSWAPRSRRSRRLVLSAAKPDLRATGADHPLTNRRLQQWMSDGRAVRQDWLTRNIQTSSRQTSRRHGRQLGIGSSLRRRLKRARDGRAKSRKDANGRNHKLIQNSTDRQRLDCAALTLSQFLSQ